MHGGTNLAGVLDPFAMKEWTKDPLAQYYSDKSWPSPVEITFCKQDQTLPVQCHSWNDGQYWIGLSKV